MIAVSFNADRYFYDVHSLVQAFYPGERVSVFVRGEKELASDPGRISLEIDLREEAGEILVRCLSGDGTGAWERAACRIPGEGERPQSIDLTPQRDREGNRRYNAKNALKRLLYQRLSRETGKRLPWGSLTGIRPTHIPKVLLEAGWGEAEILRELEETFFVSEGKARLALEIARRERGILAEAEYARGYSLYVGIPFCPTTCLYCSFPSWPAAAWASRIPEYLEALYLEMDYAARRFRDLPLYTVYFGGGTPTTLAPEALDALLSALERAFDLSRLRELTVEAGRPDSLTREKLRVLQRHHVTRLSVNPQTMQQRTLDLIGRKHTVEEVRQAFHMARESGNFKINMDLILGLPGEGSADVADTLAQVAELAPDDLTVHALALKRGSRMQALMETKGVTFPGFEDIDAAASIAERGAREMGLRPYYLYRQKNIAGNYENTGYAREGAEGLYNILINEDVHSIVALGAGAISKRVGGDRVSRAENVKELAEYLDRTPEMIERKAALYGTAF